MGAPGYLETALKSIKKYVIGWFIFNGLLMAGAYYGLYKYYDFEPLFTAIVLAIISVFLGIIIGAKVARSINKPLQALSEAILHISPSPIPVASPDIDSLSLGKELVANLTRQVYDFATRTAVTDPRPDNNLAAMSMQQLPIAVFGLDSEAKITFANPKAVEYSKSSVNIVGKDFYSLFDVLFRDETLQDWIIKSEASAVTSQHVWRGIRLNPFGDKTQYYDMTANYSKSLEKDKTQTIITLFEQNEIYGGEEKSLSFIALAVHELRTPLTILRGYIEVFEDELEEGGIRPEMAEHVQTMKAASENLTAFVGNILNVAKIEENQLSLKLHEDNWSEILTKNINDLKLRAQVHGKTIELEIAQNLPTVGVDNVSISEVITNLVDNAIKYSPPDKTLIKVRSQMTKDGLVETIVQDYGVGIPAQVMPRLFEKFSRNYRNRATVSGTGLGLYLSKALVNAHGGNIWVRSEDGQGSEFGFTLIPYANLSEAEKNGANKEIIRSSHGWIKNHSLSRR